MHLGCLFIVLIMGQAGNLNLDIGTSSQSFYFTAALLVFILVYLSIIYFNTSGTS